MGAPYFKYKSLLERNNASVFSSNYQLYGDMSRRVMQIIGSSVSEMEIYSIDEAFLKLNDIDNVEEFAIGLRSKIYRWTGISTSIGIGSTI